MIYLTICNNIIMPQKKKQKDIYQKYVLPLFVLASAMVFAVTFTIVLLPTIVTNFGYEPVFLLLMIITGTVSAMLALLFYLVLKGEIKLVE